MTFASLSRIRCRILSQYSGSGASIPLDQHTGRARVVGSIPFMSGIRTGTSLNFLSMRPVNRLPGFPHINKKYTEEAVGDTKRANKNRR